MRKRGWLTTTWDGYWGFTGPDGAANDRADAMAEVRREMGVHLRGSYKRGGGVQADRYLNLAKVEYSCAVY